jgi:hypothetical protein
VIANQVLQQLKLPGSQIASMAVPYRGAPDQVHLQPAGSKLRHRFVLSSPEHHANACLQLGKHEWFDEIIIRRTVDAALPSVRAVKIKTGERKP